MSSSPPSIAELRATTQPEWLLGRAGAEHWAGRLYMRRVSPYVTRILLRTPVTADAVTALMIPTGLLAALALTLPGLVGAAAAVALVQLQLLLDCCDGEVARWRRTSSPAGIYLDRIGHSVTIAALLGALGVRADGGWYMLNGWTTLGLLVALLVLFVALENDLVYVVRARTGRAAVASDGEAFAPESAGMRRLRRGLRFFPFFRAFSNAVDATLVVFVAAIVDAAAGTLVGTRGLLLFLVAAAVVTVTGRLIVILVSGRLR